MTSQVQINIGANASEAMATFAAVRKAAMGMRASFMALSGTLGIFGISLLPLMRIMSPLAKAIEDANEASLAFQGMNREMYKTGMVIGRVVAPAMAIASDWFQIVIGEIGRLGKAAKEGDSALASFLYFFGELGSTAANVAEARARGRKPWGAITPGEQADFDARLEATRKARGWKPKKERTESLFEMPKESNVAAFTTRGFLTRSEATGFSGAMSFQQEVVGYLSVIAANSELFSQVKDTNNA